MTSLRLSRCHFETYCHLRATTTEGIIEIVTGADVREWTLEALDEDGEARDAMDIPPEWNIEHIGKLGEKVIVLTVTKGHSFSLGTLQDLNSIKNYLESTRRGLICVTSDIQFFRAVPKK